MNILVVGGGGREHAIIKKLKESAEITELYALPGNAGIAKDAQCVGVAADDIPGMVDFAVKNKIGFAVVAPDDPLVMGMVDALEAIGVPCFGPEKKAAEIEGSKVFSKGLMKKYGIPTADYEVFDDPSKAFEYIKGKNTYPTVIKADGLAKGKGVIIAADEFEAREAIRSIMEDRKFGESGAHVVVEEFLTGPEVSVLAFTDGKTVKPMISSMDHKRARDNDEGLNTGGMGTIAPNPYYTPDIEKICMEKIFLPTVNAMNAEGRTFKGCLYFGLMLTPQGPKVIEYNCRFGDPEAQVTLPLLKSDLFTIMKAVRYGTLEETEVVNDRGAACCVIMASDGYPAEYKTGYPVIIDKDLDAEVFFAGVKEADGRLVTSGGRVLGVTVTAPTLREAIDTAYVEARKIRFENAYYRRDIGKRALEAKR